MLNFKNLKIVHAVHVQKLYEKVVYYAKCMFNYCGSFIVLLKCSSKTVPIDRNLQKPAKRLSK